MKLVDTTAWIHALRPNGDPRVVARVRLLLETGEAAWCPLVRLELWNGARGDREKRVLHDLERELPDLEISTAVWSLACDLARQARTGGVTVPASDLLIAACARHHGATLEHADAHFDALAKLPPPR